MWEDEVVKSPCKKIGISLRVSLCSPPYSCCQSSSALTAAENYGIITLASSLTTCFSHLQRHGWDSTFESNDPWWTNSPKICLNIVFYFTMSCDSEFHHLIVGFVKKTNKQTNTHNFLKICFLKFLAEKFKGHYTILLCAKIVSNHSLFIRFSLYSCGWFVFPSHWVFFRVIPINLIFLCVKYIQFSSHSHEFSLFLSRKSFAVSFWNRWTEVLISWGIFQHTEIISSMWNILI